MPLSRHQEYSQQWPEHENYHNFDTLEFFESYWRCNCFMKLFCPKSLSVPPRIIQELFAKRQQHQGNLWAMANFHLLFSLCFPCFRQWKDVSEVGTPPTGQFPTQSEPFSQLSTERTGGHGLAPRLLHCLSCYFLNCALWQLYPEFLFFLKTKWQNYFNNSDVES